MGLDGVDTSGRRAKAEGYVDASVLGWVGSQSGLDQTPHVHFSLRSYCLIGASQDLPLGKSTPGGTGLRSLCPTAFLHNCVVFEAPSAHRDCGCSGWIMRKAAGIRYLQAAYLDSV